MTTTLQNQSEAAMKLVRDYASDRWDVPTDQKAFFEIAGSNMVRAYVQFYIDGLMIGIEMIEKHYRGNLYGGAETTQSLHVVVTSDGRSHRYGLGTSRIERVDFEMLDTAFKSAKRDGFKVGF